MDKPTVRLDATRAKDLAKAIQWLREGRIGALPTETVYGLAGDATREFVVEKLFQAKGRPAHDPLIVHVSSPEAASRYGSFSESTRALLQEFWPGPLTLIVPKTDLIPYRVTAGLSTVAIRIPAHDRMRGLLARGDLALAAPSANTFGKLSPTRPEHVLQQLEGKIDFVLDDGPTGWGVESTVLDVSHPGHWKLYRPGPIALEQIADWVEQSKQEIQLVNCSEQANPKQEQKPLPSPGILSRHYAPRTPVRLVSPGDMEKVEEQILKGKPWGLLKTGLSPIKTASAPEPPLYYSSEDGTLESAARNFYARLHAMDEQGYEMLLVEKFPESGLGVALNNRLIRAVTASDAAG